MPSTRLQHPPDLTLRPRPSANTTIAPGNPDEMDAIPIHPPPSPFSLQIRAILDMESMESKLGVRI